MYLIGFRNRLQVLIDWAWKYFTSRGAGMILLEQAQDLTPDITVTDRMPFSGGDEIGSVYRTAGYS